METRTLAATGLVTAALAASGVYLLKAPGPPASKLRGVCTKGLTVHIKTLERTYHVYVPPDVKPGAALLIALHGSTLDGLTFRDWTARRFDELADERGFVIVYPDGIQQLWSDHTKNRSYSNGIRERIDELAFIKQLIQRLSEEHGISTERVYAVGYSNGGGLVMSLALEDPTLFKAVAVFCSQFPVEENRLQKPPFRPLPPFVLFSGTADSIVPHQGGEMKVAGIFSRGHALSFDETREELLERNGLDPTDLVAETITLPSPGSVTSIEKLSYGHDQIVSYTLEGGNHVVPIKGQRFGPRFLGTSADWDSPRICVDFFGL